MGTASGRSKMQSQDEQFRGSSYRTQWGYNNDKWRTSFSGGFMTDLNGL